MVSRIAYPVASKWASPLFENSGVEIFCLYSTHTAFMHCSISSRKSFSMSTSDVHILFWSLWVRRPVTMLTMLESEHDDSSSESAEISSSKLLLRFPISLWKRNGVIAFFSHLSSTGLLVNGESASATNRELGLSEKSLTDLFLSWLRTGICSFCWLQYVLFSELLFLLGIKLTGETIRLEDNSQIFLFWPKFADKPDVLGDWSWLPSSSLSKTSIGSAETAAKFREQVFTVINTAIWRTSQFTPMIFVSAWSIYLHNLIMIAGIWGACWQGSEFMNAHKLQHILLWRVTSNILIIRCKENNKFTISLNY